MESNAKKLGRLVVSTGRQKDPIRELVYGPPGVGKTTFAGDSPQPIFLGEDGARGRKGPGSGWLVRAVRLRDGSGSGDHR
jgi:hypothetical protein